VALSVSSVRVRRHGRDERVGMLVTLRMAKRRHQPPVKKDNLLKP
jgi:hypothetical protein